MEQHVTTCLTDFNTNVIPRENYLVTIDSIIQGETKVLIIEGEEGIGKSTMAHMIYERNSPSSIFITLDSHCKWGSDYRIFLYSFYSYLYQFLYDEPYNSSVNDIPENEVGYCLVKLNRKLKLKNSFIYIVIDGLEDIPIEDARVVSGYLPLSVQFTNFKLILTGDSVLLKDLIQSDKCKTFIVSGFSMNEIREFYRDYSIDEESLIEIATTSKGNPGYLASIKRTLDSGMSMKQIMESLPDNLPTALLNEWNHSNITDAITKNLLALTAFDSKSHNVDFLASVFDVTSDVVLSKVTGFKFVVFKDNSICFVSETFRKFVEKELTSLKGDVYDALIKYLQRNPHCDEAISDLPKYYYETKRYEENLVYLSDGVLNKVISKANSLKPVHEHIKYGLLSAFETKHPEVIIGYSIKCAAIEGLKTTQVWKSEISALMALGKYEQAEYIARQASLIEDQFHGYAQICSYLHRNSIDINPSLLEQLHILYNNLDASVLGDRAVEIASEVSSFDPELAINLVKSSLKVDDDHNITDIIFAKLSLNSLFNTAKDSSNDLSTEFDKHITNPSIKNITQGIKLLSKNKTAEHVLHTVSSISEVSIQILYLSEWVKNNRKSKDAIDITSYGIELILKTTDYSPNAKVILDLCSSIEFCDDKLKLNKAIDSIDCQLMNIKKLGPIEDYYKVEAVLAIGISKIDTSVSFERISDIYYEVMQEDSKYLVCNILCELLYAIHIIQSMLGTLRDAELEFVVKEDVLNAIDEMLISSADHYEITKYALGVLCMYDIDIAIDIASRLNTQQRKDFSFRNMVVAIVKRTDFLDRLDIIAGLCNSIKDSDVYEDTILFLLNQILLGEYVIPDNSRIIDHMNKIPKFTNDDARAGALSLLARYQSEHHNAQLIALDEIVNLLSDLWSGIDNVWFKIDAGYNIVSNLADCEQSMANKFLENTKEERENNIINNHSLAETNACAILLAIRAYSGLLEKNIDNDTDLDQVINRIDLMPSAVTRLRLLNDLSLKAYFANRKDRLDIICKNHIHKITKQSYANIGLGFAVICEAAPALYLYHSNTTLEELKKLPIDLKEKAARNIIRSILTRRSTLDPVDLWNISNIHVTYEQLDDAIRLLPLIERDYSLYEVLDHLGDVFLLNEKHIDRQQRSALEDKLNKIIANQLPWTHGIRHDGYVIVSKAQLVRMFKPRIETEWNSLVKNARNIENIADRCHVLGIVYGLMTGRIAQSNEKILQEVEELILKLPTRVEMIEHYVGLTHCIRKVNKTKSREYIKKAMDVLLQGEENNNRNWQKEIINIAYYMDKDLAASLASLADDDPAKAHVKQDMKRQMNVLNMKTDLFKHAVDTAINENSGLALPEASWKYLAELNSNQIGTYNGIDSALSEIKLASEMRISDAYPVYACVIENLVVRYKTTEQAKLVLRPLFDYLISTIDMIYSMTTSLTNNKLLPLKANKASEDDSGWLYVINGEREKAIRFITKWLENNFNEAVYVCDRYFTYKDIELLEVFQSVNSDLRVTIITSKCFNAEPDIKEVYLEEWKKNRSDSPPKTDIYLMDYGDKHQSPIHDRWYMTESSGLNVGTSFNSLGYSVSKISTMTEQEVEYALQLMYGYIMKKTSLLNGQKLKYDIHTLE